MKVTMTIGLVIGAVFLILSGLSAQALAQVDANIGLSVPLPPPLLIPAPPAVALIPRTRVYRALNIEVDLLVYRGWWYRPHEGHWFRARSYQGPWFFILPSKVPHALVALPADYRQIPLEQPKVHHKKVKTTKSKEPPPPKTKKVKPAKDVHKDEPKGKKEGKSQGSSLKSPINKSN